MVKEGLAAEFEILLYEVYGNDLSRL